MFQERPALTEPGVKSFLSHTLKHCHKVKSEYYNKVFNIGLLVAFLSLVVGLLVYKYKGKLSPAEIHLKNQEKQQYVLNRIKQFRISKERAQNALITGLPHWDNAV